MLVMGEPPLVRKGARRQQDVLTEISCNDMSSFSSWMSLESVLNVGK